MKAFDLRDLAVGDLVLTPFGGRLYAKDIVLSRNDWGWEITFEIRGQTEESVKDVLKSRAARLPPTETPAP